jgi:hypothetical protein
MNTRVNSSAPIEVVNFEDQWSDVDPNFNESKIRVVIASLDAEAKGYLKQQIKEVVENSINGGDDPKDPKKPPAAKPASPPVSRAPYLVNMPPVAVDNTAVVNHSAIEAELQVSMVKNFDSKLAELKKERDAFVSGIPAVGAQNFGILDIAVGKSSEVQDIARNYYGLPVGAPLAYFGEDERRFRDREHGFRCRER